MISRALVATGLLLYGGVTVLCIGITTLAIVYIAEQVWMIL